MKILSIIPVKDLDHTKSRLSRILDLRARQMLTVCLVERTLRLLKSVGEEIAGIMILSPDPRVLTMAERFRVLGLRERAKGLNGALSETTQWAIRQGYEAVLIIPSDLPYLRENDIKTVISKGSEHERMVIVVPDKERKGTNGLFVKPPGILRYCFGNDSLMRHRTQALIRGFELGMYTSETMEFDLDRPEQYQQMRRSQQTGNTAEEFQEQTRRFNPDSWDTPNRAWR
jgi:2-phospho-L-lactate guanylyltransferase